MNILAKYEAMKRVKEDYLIGSQQAYLYNEALVDYERLQKSLDIRPLPSIREVGCISVKIQDLLCSYLRLRAISLSSAYDLGLVSEHEVLPWTRGGRRDYWNDNKIPGSFSNLYNWEVDYPKLINRYFSYPVELGDQRIRIMLESLQESRDCFLCLVKPKGDRAISLLDFEEDSQWRRGSKKEFKAEIEYYQDQEDAPDEIHAIDINSLWEDNEILVSAHNFIQAIKMENAVFDFEVRERENSLFLGEELNLWNWYDWYKRAENEYTLGTIDTERRIVVGYIYSLQSFTGLKGRKLVLEALKKAEEKLKERVAKKARLFSLWAPHSILEAAIRMEKEARYLWLSLKKNQRWLTAFFEA